MTPESLVQERANWSVYARNELLSVAVQGIFYALLDGYEASGQRFHASNQLVDWFIQTPEIKSVLAAIGASQSFSQVVESNAVQLPPLTNWAEPNHEIQYAEQVAQPLPQRTVHSKPKRHRLSCTSRSFLPSASFFIGDQSV